MKNNNMRQFIRIVEQAFDYGSLSQEQLVAHVAAEDDNSDGKLHVNDAHWVYDSHFPIDRLIPAMAGGVRAWREWYADELELDREEELRRGWADLSVEEITDPVIVAFPDDGSVQIWNGWHRTAGSIARGAATIPVIYGVPKSQLRGPQT